MYSWHSNITKNNENWNSPTQALYSWTNIKKSFLIYPHVSEKRIIDQHLRNWCWSNSIWFYKHNELDFSSKLDFGKQRKDQKVFQVREYNVRRKWIQKESSKFVELWRGYLSKKYILLVNGHEESSSKWTQDYERIGKSDSLGTMDYLSYLHIPTAVRNGVIYVKYYDFIFL